MIWMLCCYSLFLSAFCILFIEILLFDRSLNKTRPLHISLFSVNIYLLIVRAYNIISCVEPALLPVHSQASFLFFLSIMQQLLATSDTTTLNYWLNWRVLLCAIWVVTPVAVAFFLIRKYECLGSCKGKTQQEVAHSLCGNQPWRSCLIHVHPLWLLAYRLISFSLLLAILIAKVSRNGFVMFYYYTQWTFTSVTIYFGFGSLLSIYGCYLYHKRGGARFYEPHVGRDNEQGYYIPLPHGDRANILEKRKSSEPPEETQSSQAASICSYLFQVIFQMTAGAVMLTDSIYWFIIFPFLTLRDYSMDFLTVSMHSLNAVLLLGDTALNCLPFPWFRVSYFILWTGFFVIFQWILHACVSIWWPYPFLDLSSIYAPIWYLLVAMMHIPSYGLFMLFVKIKHNLLTKWFPQSYSC